MTRRKTTKKSTKNKLLPNLGAGGIKKGKVARAASLPAVKSLQGTSKHEKVKHDLRFNVSLIMLIALLSVAAYLLLFALTGANVSFPAHGNVAVKKAVNNAGKMDFKPPVNPRKLDDGSLDFKLTIPLQMGEWMYKIGNVVSPVDESLTNQYVNVYVPSRGHSTSSNFEEKYFTVLTIRKYTEGELKKLEKGCEKGNEAFCEQAGTKIGEKDDSAWVAVQAKSCPQEFAKECKLAESAVKSFQLN